MSSFPQDKMNHPYDIEVNGSIILVLYITYYHLQPGLLLTSKSHRTSSFLGIAQDLPILPKIKLDFAQLLASNILVPLIMQLQCLPWSLSITNLPPSDILWLLSIGPITTNRPHFFTHTRYSNVHRWLQHFLISFHDISPSQMELCLHDGWL